MARAYASDLAYIHDVGFGAFAERVAPFLIGLLERAAPDGRRVVDLGCGSGILARHLVDAGYTVEGVDLSAPMIRLARARVPEARFRVGSFVDFELPACAAVSAIGEPLAYLFDATNTRRALFGLFRRVYDNLERGGLFVFDLREPGTGGRSGWYEGSTLGTDWAIFYRVRESHGGRRLTREFTTFRRVGARYRRGEETHRLRLYRATEIAAELRRIGFRARIVRSFGDLALAPRQAGFIARKP